MYICSKHKFDFIVRICLYYTSFMNEFEVVSVFRSSRIIIQLMLLTNLFMFVHFIQTLFIKYFV